MDNNDILRSLRYTFDLGDQQMMDVFALADKEVTRAEVSNWLKKEEDTDFSIMKDVELATFLNGFINNKRGKKEGEQPVPEKKITNNIVLRKLKIALNFREDEMLATFKLADMRISKHELSAFFRKPTQSQYRECKDQFLRNFLAGLKEKYRPSKKA